jgi:hypothetical protein
MSILNKIKCWFAHDWYHWYPNNDANQYTGQMICARCKKIKDVKLLKLGEHNEEKTDT